MNEIQRLNNKICCKSNKFYDTFADFPETGKVNTLYINRESGNIYLWDGDSYISTSDRNLLKVKRYDGTPLSPEIYDIVLLERG